MSGRGAPAARAGFVLLELLAVLMILALAVAVGASALSRRAMPATPLQVAEQVQATMLRARAEAVRTGAETAVVIDLAGRRVVSLPGASAIALPRAMQVRVRTGAELVTGGREARLVFRPDGTSSGGELGLEQAGRTAGIEVSWLTGLPRVLGRAGR
jgi:general secretion pathway protein H